MKQRVLVRIERKENPFYTVGGNANSCRHSGKLFMKKLKNRATLWPINCTTRYLSKGFKHNGSKGYMHPNIYSDNVHNSQTMERAHSHRQKSGWRSCGLGRLGSTVVKCLPSAQGMIPALWDRVPHRAPQLGACFFLSHSPAVFPLSLAVFLSHKWIKSLKKN